MKKPKKYEPDDKEQSARFVEEAERVKSDDTKNKFKEACARILKKKDRS